MAAKLTVQNGGVVEAVPTTKLGLPMPPGQHGYSPVHEPTRGHGVQVVLRRLDQTKKGLLKAPFYFQCPPGESWRWSAAYNHADVDHLDSTQRDQPQARQLKTVTFSTLFIDYDASWVAYHYGTAKGLPPVDPLEWTRQLLDLLDSGTPFAMSLGTPARWGRWDVRAMPVTLRTLDVEERAGEPDARYLDVAFTEHLESVLAMRGRGLPVAVTLHESGKATWDRGDGPESMKAPTLAKLAKHFYGSAGLWRRITSGHPTLRKLAGSSDLARYAARHGHGRKGHREMKITVPEAPPSKTQKSIASTGILAES